MLPKKAGVLVEVGSGEGQLTVPFADLVPRYKIIALDRFKGAYSGNEAGLLSTIVRNGLNARISVVVKLQCLADLPAGFQVRRSNLQRVSS